MKVLIGTSVRQDEETFKLYLDSLDKLEVPDGVEFHKYFILHNSPHLEPILKNHKDFGTTLGFGTCENEVDYSKDETTHYWNNGAIHTIPLIKNHIIDTARNGEYDYVFFVDSDLILQPETLRHLIEQQKDVIAEVFWTKWTPDSQEEPNAWDYDVYDFKGKKEDRLLQWRVPGVYEVGMSGACILISRNVMLNPFVNYSRIPNLQLWGEGRHFCIRANVCGFQVYLDTTYPAKHLYRKSDLEELNQ